MGKSGDRVVGLFLWQGSCVGPVSGLAALHDNGNGTVSDSVTGLMWQQGDTQNVSGRNWEDALDYCEAPTLPSGGYTDWRLPNVRELESIMDWDRYNPAIDTAYFPDCRYTPYWSSSTYAYYTDSAWYVNFAYGYVGNYNKTLNYYVRCVRGGPSGSFDYYVSPDGTCGGKIPCYTSIQEAINAATTGATIRIAQGTYTESITLSTPKSLTLQGGWDTSFTSQASNTTFIKAPKAPQGSLTLQMVTIKALIGGVRTHMTQLALPPKMRTAL